MAATDDKLAASATPGFQPPTEPLRPGESATATRLGRVLAGRLGAELSRRLGAAATITPDATEAVSYADFLASLQEPACCWLLSCPAGPSWLELSPGIAKALATSLLDGRAESLRSDQPPTSVERRLLRGFVDCVNLAVAQAGEPELTGKPQPEPPPQQQSSAERQMIAASFVIRLPSIEGAMRLGLPRELCRPAPAATEEPAAQPPTQPKPPREEAADRSKTPDAGHATAPSPEPSPREPVELSVAAPETTMAMDELASLAPGDVLVTDADADGEVFVYLGGQKRFAGRLGSRNGKRAITLLRRLDEPAEDAPPTP